MMNPVYLSFGVIALICLFWLVLVLKITLFKYLRLKKQSLTDEVGRAVSGKIISASFQSTKKMALQRIKVQFPNFAGTLIEQEFHFIDSRPDENRYAEGKSVSVLLDDSNGTPSAKLAGAKTAIGPGFIIYSLILITATLYGINYLYQAGVDRLQGVQGRSEMVFGLDNAIPNLGGIFIGILIFQWILFRSISKIGTVRKKTSDLDFKFYGEKTTAQINRYEDTGVEINGNPKVKFHYRYTTHSGHEYSGEDAIIVGKLDIGLIPQMTERELFYLPEKPTESKFAENLNAQFGLSGCLNTILILQALIYSVILISMYLTWI